jgi:hypothetical protein
MDEAASLRKIAAKLRQLECGMVELVHDGYKVTQDPDQGCDRPYSIRPYKPF